MICLPRAGEAMQYADGQDIRVGDIVSVGPDRDGVVVCIITDGAYTDDYPAAAWSYLGKGLMINFKAYGLVYQDAPEDDLTLVSRTMGANQKVLRDPPP